MPVCDCGAYIRRGVQCSQCELEERGDGLYRNQCAHCGTTGVDEDFCDGCRAEFGERTSHGGGD